MADALSILGQLAPAANTLGTLYTAPGTATVSCSSVVVCNQAGAASTFRVSAAVNGAADGTIQYLYYDTPIAANDTFVATLGITMGTSDQIRVRSGNGSVSFNLFGVVVS